jgi:hypothetical protein
MSRDILDEFEQQRSRPAYRVVSATLGLVVEDRATGFCGDIVAATGEAVMLRDRRGGTRLFTYKPGGFLLDGQPVTLVRPAVAKPSAPQLTNSGSRVVAKPTRATTAKASRIWVEGRHDAELIEHVWGDDLRELGIVVEPMHGLDNVAAMVGEFQPGPQRRLGLLVDHLVVGSKEARLTATLDRRYVLVTGHPFVDVWEGIRPRVIGLDEWPPVPRGRPWKEGMCAALGVELVGFWPKLRNKVQSFRDLRPELVGAVEQLIDFVAEQPEA